MCGIFGLAVKNTKKVSFKEIENYTNTLFELSESRGKEASGIALFKETEISVLKVAGRASELIRQNVYRDLFSTNRQSGPINLIGHSRLATNGIPTDNLNNQPLYNSSCAVVHNGVIVNTQYLWRKILNDKPKYEVDTEVLVELIKHYHEKGYKLEDAVKNTFSQLDGSASVAFIVSFEPSMVLATNTGSLYYSKLKSQGIFIFASEYYIMKRFIDRYYSDITNINITQLRPECALIVDTQTLYERIFKLNRVISLSKNNPTRKLFSIRQINNKSLKDDINTIYSVNNKIKELKRHDFDYIKIERLQRCTRCILPSTMPFIEFDENGVCNWCVNHKKIHYRGKEALEDFVNPYRKSGKPDCIVAFSGGRDSSYGLHFIKKELGMNPIAYTYDWGMVTDLARRNQARLVGRLGVEHIIVSADITKKRNYIRQNILAWLKKPDLGMVPLFMAGDKQGEYYADELAIKTGIKLIFYCRGNELENEDFKWGYCGIKEGSPGGVIHNLSVGGKVKIASYYAKQFLTNPYYLNASIADTLFGYYSIYIQRHDYAYLWHYIPWNEEKIISTLTKKYGWEIDTVSNTTWRTDDGSPAFYNYIFLQIQGFTENDTFRSNQIREGLMTRPEALRLVSQENKPRYTALKWYFDQVGLEGHKILKAIDMIPKKY